MQGARRVLWEPFEAGEPLSFRELKTRCADVSSSVLTRRIAELRDARLVARRADGSGLSELGKGLVAGLQPLLAWSQTWVDDLQRAAGEETRGPMPASRWSVERLSGGLAAAPRL